MRTVESSRRFVRTWCKSRDIELIESGLVKVPHAVYEKTSGRKMIYLPLISSVNFDEWCRITYHESAHLSPKNIWHYKVLEVLSHEKGQMLHETSNCIIDNLAERTDFKEYRGRARLLSSARAEFTDKLGVILEMDTPDPKHILRSALLKWDMINRESWMVNFAAPVAHKSLPHLDEYFDGINSMDLGKWLDRVHASDNEAENIKVLVALVMQIDALLPKQDEEQDEKSNQGDNKGEEGSEGSSVATASGEGGEDEGTEGGEGTSKDDSHGEETGENGRGQDSNSGDERGSGEAGEDGDGGKNGKDTQPEDESGGSGSGASSESGDRSEQSQERDGEDYGHNIQQSEGIAATVEYSPSQKQVLKEYNEDLNRPVDIYANSVDQASSYQMKNIRYYIPCATQLRTEIPNNIRRGYYSARRYEQIMKMCAESNLDKQVRRHLQLQVHGRIVHGTKRGKLSGKSLHRLYNGNTAVQPAVFKKQEHGKVRMDTALTLIVDMSGSMGKNFNAAKYNLAAASAIAMSEVLAGLRIKHEILGFTEHPGVNEVFILKKFTDRVMSRDLLAKKFSANKIDQDYNTDGEALQYAAERLMRMKETNKVLMIMSDGMPAGRYKGDGAYYLQTVVDDIENNSPIHLCAIGIQSDAVEKFYKNVQVIDDMQELTPAVLTTLKANLLTT
jgi:cobalamin biosynthesis protein CobT